MEYLYPLRFFIMLVSDTRTSALLMFVCPLMTFATAPTVTINQAFFEASAENIGFSDINIKLNAPWSELGRH